MTNIIEQIGSKLAVRYKFIEDWVKTNNFDLNQLAILAEQITYDDINNINKRPLILSIINNTEYKISL